MEWRALREQENEDANAGAGPIRDRMIRDRVLSAPQCASIAVDEVEIPLLGGDITSGVVRVGGTVRRPVGPHTPAVHALLRHLEDVGFKGSPRVLGIDEKNREILTYLPGKVLRRPLPAYALTESTLAALAELQYSYHQAVASFKPPPGASWDGVLTRLVDWPPEIVCHCDVNLENVVFRDGPAGPRPYAFIDFDLARPGTRLVDVIQTLRYWAPLAEPADRLPALRDADAAARVAVFCEAYGLSRDARARLVPVAEWWLRRSRVTIAQRAKARGGAWARMLDQGVGERLLRSAAWLERSRRDIEARLGLSARARAGSTGTTGSTGTGRGTAAMVSSMVSSCDVDGENRG
jgi:Ser/Thr protein kinase RdoA (MazF antagonist)